MAADLATTDQIVKLILEVVQAPFWTHPNFWVEALGLFFAVLAFWEARQAKRAATAAGRTVKIQTVTIELTEISQKLDKIEPEIKFRQARDLLSETSRRVLRATATFANDELLKENIGNLLKALNEATTSLNSVRPNSGAAEAEVPQVVYYAVESHFSNINNILAQLIGLFEKKSIDIGD